MAKLTQEQIWAIVQNIRANLLANPLFVNINNANNRYVYNKSYNTHLDKKANPHEITNDILLQNINESIISGVLGNSTWQQPVISFFDPTSGLEPILPIEGDRYISSANGYITTSYGISAWKKNNIYEYTNSIWQEITTVEGFVTYKKDDNQIYYFDGTDWTLLNGSSPIVAFDKLVLTPQDSEPDSITGKVIIYVENNTGKTLWKKYDDGTKEEIVTTPTGSL